MAGITGAGKRGKMVVCGGRGHLQTGHLVVQCRGINRAKGRCGRVWNVVRYAVVDSTNRQAKVLARQGCGDTAVLARRQTAGRGRLGRSFQSPDGGMYLSALWRGCSAGALLRVTPMAAVAVCRALEKLWGLECGIKWCNDVVARGRKLCGILTESSLLPDGGAEWLVVGIGINGAKAAFDPEVAALAISLEELGIRAETETLAAAVLEELTVLRRELETPETWLAEYRRRCVNLGQELQVLRRGTARTATAVDIDGEFGLTVRYGDGTVETLRSGEVSVRGLYGYVDEVKK